MRPALLLTFCFITGITASPVPPSSSCSAPCEWTPWINVDRPTNTTEGGDFETLDNIREAGYKICQAPRDIECRSVRYPYMPLRELKDAVECSANKGLICSNQKSGGECLDYEVRLLCCPCDQIFNSQELGTPSPLQQSTGSKDNNYKNNTTCSWSQWFNIFNPTSGPDGGDFETFENIRAKGYTVCSAPQAVMCRLVRFPYIPLDQLNYTQECGVSQGLVCENKNQGNDTCLDYKIQILCCTSDNSSSALWGVETSVAPEEGQLANATEATLQSRSLFTSGPTSLFVSPSASPTTIDATVPPNTNPESAPLFEEEGSSSGMEGVFSPVTLETMTTAVPPNNIPETSPLFEEQGSSFGMEEVFSPVPYTTVLPDNNETARLSEEQGYSSGMEELSSPVPYTTVLPDNNETARLSEEQGYSSGMEELSSPVPYTTVLPDNNETARLSEEQGYSSGMEELSSPVPSMTITITGPPDNHLNHHNIARREAGEFTMLKNNGYSPVFFIDPTYLPTKPIDAPTKKKKRYPMPSSPFIVTFPPDNNNLDGPDMSGSGMDMVDNFREQENN
ncbi:mucin-5B [Xenopus tropicalis]|uniref:Mucin-5B n=1 Tax=Xenopus tropicalis TaxID=8364 RepID=A0A8J0QQC7_XENTR|nr:mucin-5B [Xenopus tropicalis]